MFISENFNVHDDDDEDENGLHHDENAAYSDQENINYTYASCNSKLIANENLGPAYIEDSCNTKNGLCLYKSYVNATSVASNVVVDHHPQAYHLNQVVDNNNYNITYSNQIDDGQYASCSSHNISMISSACYTSTQTMSYPAVNYNAVYPIKDVNKNYEEASSQLNFQLIQNNNQLFYRNA